MNTNRKKQAVLLMLVVVIAGLLFISFAGVLAGSSAGLFVMLFPLQQARA